VSNEGRRRPAMSTYYRSGAQANDKPSPFEKRSIRSKRGKKLLIKIADLLAVALLIFLVIHSLIVSNDAKVIASDTSYHTQTNYQDSAKHYIKSLRNRNKVTFDTAAIVRSYQNDYPEVKATSVELPIFSQKPVIRLQISEPSFFLRSGDKEYLIDASGRAVAYSYQYPKVKGLPIIIDQSGFTIKKGQPVLSDDNIAFIKAVLAHCVSNGVKVQSITLPASASEMDLRTSDRPYFVKFYLGGDSAVQIGQFLAARHQFDQKNSQPTEYLDVRVGGKVFYK
jgi:hypothetical protein